MRRRWLTGLTHPDAVDRIAKNGDDRGGITVAFVENGGRILHRKGAVHDTNRSQALVHQRHHVVGRQRRQANEVKPVHHGCWKVVTFFHVANQYQQRIQSLKGRVSVSQGNLKNGKIACRNVNNNHRKFVVVGVHFIHQFGDQLRTTCRRLTSNHLPITHAEKRCRRRVSRQVIDGCHRSSIGFQATDQRGSA